MRDTHDRTKCTHGYARVADSFDRKMLLRTVSDKARRYDVNGIVKVSNGISVRIVDRRSR